MVPRFDVPPGGPGAVPELDLGVRKSATPKPKPRTQPAAEISLELAVDPRALVRERSDGASGESSQSDRSVAPEWARPAPQAPVPAAHDLAFDARLLAAYGDPPSRWLLSPLYAWRVLKRRHELKGALGGRREEAARAANEAQDALVALAARVRATAEKAASYVPALEELRHAEELLRSRDGVLAAEQDAQNARLSQIDARLSNLETDLADAVVKQRAAEAQAKLETARAERNSLEEWFRRQVGTRAEAAAEARKQVTLRMVTVARRAFADRGVFGAEFDTAREQIARLELAAESAARDVMVYEEARKTYDTRSLRRGLTLIVILVLVFVVAPIVWRAVRVVEPPSPHDRPPGSDLGALP